VVAAKNPHLQANKLTQTASQKVAHQIGKAWWVYSIILVLAA
jgi:hypothetical protein